MPIISHSTYKPPFIFRLRHVNTIFPALFRSFPEFEYQRERITTPDGDFIDLDWSPSGSERLLIVLHGLEGNADRHYVKGMIRHFSHNGWDGVGMNLRSCSGELNSKLHSYHMGVSDDLAHVIAHVIANYNYSTIVLSGFSMGGNIVLKYLGEQKNNLPKEVKAAVTFSVPCHIQSANVNIEKWYNWQYVRRFMKTLNKKVEQKAVKFPDQLNIDKPMPRNFTEFDERFTSKLHGFKDAVDYWTQCSCKQFLHNIRIPTLLVNAKDDSFLSEACFPYNIAKKNPYFYLETPAHGGHVGLSGQGGSDGTYWTENRAHKFVEKALKDTNDIQLN
jgi:predicted alpha/beta-fold hydrolase